LPSYESVSKDVHKLCGRSIRVRYAEQELRESALFSRVLALRLGLFYDLLPSSPSARESFLQFRRTIFSVSEIDVEPYAGDWKNIKEIFLQSLEKWELPTFRDWPRAFKQRVCDRIQNKWIWNSVQALMLEGCGIGAIVQWIVFDEKLNLRSLDLTDQMVTEYEDAEQQMATWSYDPPQQLYEVIDDWSTSFCLQQYPFIPKHGNGATAEVPRRQATRGRKSERLVYDDQILAWVQRRDISNIDPTFWFPAGRGDVNRTARLQCVPKSMVKNRTISAEPTVLQYLQQDLFNVMDEWFSTTRPLCEHIDLHDQSRSAKACLEASREGALASIDLSAASDSVTCKLIELLLKDTNFDDLLRGLMTTRSSCVVTPAGRLIRLSKYGGMGNGTTFPVETFVFASLCECAARMATGTVDHTIRYYVYGDDILIDTKVVPVLLRLLDECHFTVNSTKSYWSTTGHIFREAGGMWACDGMDITPLRLSRRLYWDDGLSVTEAAGWVSLYNDSLRYGYLTLRRVINTLLQHLPWFPRIPRLSITDEQRGGTYDSIQALTLDGCDTQWNVRSRFAQGFRDKRGGYQRIQYRCCGARTKTLPEDVSDEVLYFNWQLETLKRHEDEGNEPSDVEFGHSGPTVQRWTEIWAQLNFS